MGLFSLASAFSPNWVVLASLRFAVGASAAFFFAPALGLVTSYYPEGSRGPIIGAYNSGFSIGSGVGLFGGALIGEAFGWPAALLVGSVLLLVVGVAAPWFLPVTGGMLGRRRIREIWDSATPILFSRSIWALAVGTAGLWGALFIVAQYFLDYASVVHSAWPIALAASLPTVMILLEIPGGPIGGWLAERAGEMRGMLLLWSLLCGVGILLIPFLPLLGLFGLFAFLGFADGVIFAVLYLVPTYLAEVHGENLALGLAFLNSIQIFLGSATSIVFGYLAGTVGYGAAWWFAGAVSIAPLPLLAWVSSRRGAIGSPAFPAPGSGRSVRLPHRPA